MESAISPGVDAPRSRPTGLWMRRDDLLGHALGAQRLEVMAGVAAAADQPDEPGLAAAAAPRAPGPGRRRRGRCARRKPRAERRAELDPANRWPPASRPFEPFRPRLDQHRSEPDLGRHAQERPRDRRGGEHDQRRRRQRAARRRPRSSRGRAGRCAARERRLRRCAAASASAAASNSLQPRVPASVAVRDSRSLAPVWDGGSPSSLTTVASSDLLAAGDAAAPAPPRR